MKILLTLLLLVPSLSLGKVIKLSCESISREMFDTNEKIIYEKPYPEDIFSLDLEKGILAIESLSILYPLSSIEEDYYRFKTAGKNYNYADLNRYSLELHRGLIRDNTVITKDTLLCKKIEKQI